MGRGEDAARALTATPWTRAIRASLRGLCAIGGRRRGRGDGPEPSPGPVHVRVASAAGRVVRWRVGRSRGVPRGYAYESGVEGEANDRSVARGTAADVTP